MIISFFHLYLHECGRLFMYARMNNKIDRHWRVAFIVELDADVDFVFDSTETVPLKLLRRVIL